MDLYKFVHSIPLMLRVCTNDINSLNQRFFFGKKEGLGAREHRLHEWVKVISSLNCCNFERISEKN